MREHEDARTARLRQGYGSEHEDASKCKVGQEVFLVNNFWLTKGTVAEVGPDGTTVQTVDGDVFHFDKDGNGIESERSHEGLGWNLDDMPFEDREPDWLERGGRRRERH